MRKKKLVNNEQTFDEWFAAYIADNDLGGESSNEIRRLHDIARAASIRGYSWGSNAMFNAMNQ